MGALIGVRFFRFALFLLVPHVSSRPRGALATALLLAVLGSTPLVRVTAQEISREKAQTLYRQLCQRCHEADGRGGGTREIPDFTKRAWHDEKSTTQLVVSILEGKGALMPSFRGKLDEARAKGLVAHIRAFALAPAARPLEIEVNRSFDKQLQELHDELQELKRQLKALNNTTAEATRPMALADRKGAQEETGKQRGLEVSALFKSHCQRCHGKDGKGVANKLDSSDPPDFSSSKWHEGRSDSELFTAIVNGKGAGMPAFGKRFSEEEARGLVEYLRTLTSPRRLKPRGSPGPS
jgi:mono/diheme cytochrome c family protein